MRTLPKTLSHVPPLPDGVILVPTLGDAVALCGLASNHGYKWPSEPGIAPGPRLYGKGMAYAIGMRYDYTDRREPLDEQGRKRPKQGSQHRYITMHPIGFDKENTKAVTLEKYLTTITKKR